MELFEQEANPLAQRRSALRSNANNQDFGRI
jgi:hypothetical protein